MQEIKQVSNLTFTFMAKFSLTLRDEKGKTEDELIRVSSRLCCQKKIRLELFTLPPKRNNKIIQRHIFPQFIFHSFVSAFLVCKFECHCIYHAHFFKLKNIFRWDCHCLSGMQPAAPA